MAFNKTSRADALRISRTKKTILKGISLPFLFNRFIVKGYTF